MRSKPLKARISSVAPGCSAQSSNQSGEGVALFVTRELRETCPNRF
jgi:hypothetical protein